MAKLVINCSAHVTLRHARISIFTCPVYFLSKEILHKNDIIFKQKFSRVLMFFMNRKTQHASQGQGSRAGSRGVSSTTAAHEGG
jgi:1-acyl-sn-glycerol-3-phosphate acyltransferase